MRLARTLPAALVPALLSLHASAASPRRITWIEFQKLSDQDKAALAEKHVVRTDRFWEVMLDSYHVRTDVSRDYALATAVRMDEFYRDFSTVFTGAFRVRYRPQLYAMKDHASYLAAVSEWAGLKQDLPEWSAGLFLSANNRYALFGNAAPGEEKLHKTLFHEGTHQLLHFYIGRPFPRWFDEGTATNFETWDVRFSVDRNISEEIWRSSYSTYIYAMRKGLLKNPPPQKEPDLVALMSASDALWLKSEDPTCLYAQAWCLINYVLSHGKAGEIWFNRLVTSFCSGRTAVFSKKDLQSLNDEWQQYILRFIIPHFEYSRVVQKMLLDNKPREALAHLNAGLVLYPDNPELLYYKGLFLCYAKDYANALAVLEPLDTRFPRHPQLTRVLALCAFKAGDKAKGRKFAVAALREDYLDSEISALLASQ